MMMHAFVLSVVALFANEVHAARLRVTPLFTVSYPPPPIALSDDGGLAFSDRYVFFGTDGGVFRAPLPMGKSTQPVHLAFASTSVTGLQFREGTLYAILDGMGHSLLKSTDDGVSWTPIDQALEECAFGHCEFLSASQLELVGDRIFVNAGGNVLVSGDEGASWNVLFGATSNGKPQAQACYDPAFAIIGERLLIGGECPLDVAYLRTGTLRPDLLEWEQEPELAATPFLENRNVQFIRRRGESNVVYAGIEGALMRSGDAGASYDFVLHYEGQAPKYPYITHILLPSQHRSAILIGGFDKANGGPFLSMSTDNGATWTDQSDLLPGAGHFAWSVTAMEETPNGQLVIAVEDDEAGALHLFEVHVPARRRAVRH
ncbi:MAG TPA: hypothetical protein VEK79_02695 [Thermoanaerobaculia bacterium]|nr:hypothetical protein [Thermoanaerobaculia bacterium]